MGGRSFLTPAAGGGDLAGAHEVADVLLEKLVVVVQLVVLLLDRLDAVENRQERILECLGVSIMSSSVIVLVSPRGPYRVGERVHSLPQLVSCFPAKRLQVLTRSPRAHGPHVVGLESRVYGPDGIGIAGHNDGAAGFAARQPRSRRDGRMDDLVVDGGGRRGVRPLDARLLRGLYVVLVVHD